MDVNTGTPTLIGPFGLGAQTGLRLAYDRSLGMYAVDNLTDNILRIDLNTGAATLLGPIGPAGPHVISPAFIPEPASLALLALAGLAAARRR